MGGSRKIYQPVPSWIRGIWSGKQHFILNILKISPKMNCQRIRRLGLNLGLTCSKTVIFVWKNWFLYTYIAAYDRLQIIIISILQWSFLYAAFMVHVQLNLIITTTYSLHPKSALKKIQNKIFLMFDSWLTIYLFFVLFRYVLPWTHKMLSPMEVI